MIRIILPSALLLLSCPLDFVQAETLTSPSGKVTVDIQAEDGQLSYSMDIDGESAIETSTLGFTLNGTERGTDVSLEAGIADTVDESFPSRHGVHATGRNHYNELRIPVTDNSTGESYFLSFRAHDQGIAFRYELEYEGAKNFTAEDTGFLLRPGSEVFWQGGKDVYENIYGSSEISQIGTNAEMGPPTLVALPENDTFLAITHATVEQGFPNPFLTKVADPSGRLLRNTYLQNGDNTFGASTGAHLYSPWNVIMAGNLNELVNNDIVESLSPTPDPALFPDGAETEWAQAGRSVWDWMSRFPGGITPENSKLESLWASRLGFEYNTIDEGWANWNDGDPWPELQSVVDESEALGVKVLVWKRSKELRTREQRETFFTRLNELGVRGFKADFFDFNALSPAAKERTRLVERLIKDAAEHELVVNLHGVSKPIGQFRTYPNLLSIEGVYGKESFPNATTTVQIPFTRLLAGPADYTPLGLQGNLQGDQTAAFEVATVAAMAGPLITFAERADRIAQSPFAPLITPIPCLWDETIVLPGSVPGETCALARRDGDDWFVAILNAGSEREWTIDLSFLESEQTYQAEIARDGNDALEHRLITSTDELTATTLPGGGFVARFTLPPPEPIDELPFETSFSTGRGDFYAEDGIIISEEPWASELLADRLPDSLWQVSGESLSPSLDTTESWQGGSSIRVEAVPGSTGELELYQTQISITASTRLALTYKCDHSLSTGAQIGLRFEDGSTAQFDLASPGALAWESSEIDLSAHASQTLSSIFIRFQPAASLSSYDFHLGRLALFNVPLGTTATPFDFRAENTNFSGLDLVTTTLRWQAAPGEIVAYSIYQRDPVGGSVVWHGVTTGEEITLAATRLSEESEAVFEIAAIGRNGITSSRLQTTTPFPLRPSLGEPLQGQVIGTTGSFQNSGNTRDNVFDSDVSTYFDALVGNGVWAGLDLGPDSESEIAAVRYYPRSDWAVRMIDGRFQGSNDADFNNAVTLATVTEQPVEGHFTTVVIPDAGTFRYLRYLSPNGGWGNVAEVEFLPPGPPEAPADVEAKRKKTSAIVDWTPLASASFYRVKRATISGGPYLTVGEDIESPPFTDNSLTAGEDYYYIVCSISLEDEEGPHSAKVKAIDDYREWFQAAGGDPSSPLAGFEDDADDDGQANGIEYGIAGFGLARDSAKRNLLAEVRMDPLMDITCFYSPNLSDWEPVLPEPPVSQDGVASGFERVAFSIVESNARGFYQLVLTR
jgi:alpha-glucosidase